MSLIKLSDVADVIMGQSPPGETYNSNGNGLPFFQGKSEFGRVSPVAVKWCTEPTKVANVGDILISVRAPVGPTNLVDQKCCIGRGLAAIRPNPDLADRDFVWLYLQYYQKELVKKGQGSTFEAINGDDLNGIEFPNILVLNQRQIATRLKAQLAEVETARQAVRVQLSDSRLLRSRLLKEFFAEFDAAPKKKLGDYAVTTSGSTPSRGNKQYWQPAEIAWVKTSEVAFAPITSTEEAISKTALTECSLSLLPPKTILIAMYGQGKTRGQSAILEIPATTNQACFAVLPNDTWEPDFLYLWLKASYQDLRDLSEDRGGNQANLNGALLKALDVPAPSKAEQQQIVERIQAAMTEIDAIENASKAVLEDIDRLPNRILAQAFDPCA